jgi:hypothetical protein
MCYKPILGMKLHLLKNIYIKTGKHLSSETLHI